MPRESSAIIAALAVLLCASQSQAGSTFEKCLKPSTPAFCTGARFTELSKLGFVNNVATPAAVVLASTAAHVADAVRCARAANLKVCARSGGHSFAGKSLCGGVLIDVGPMKDVTVNGAGIATVGAGLTVGHLLVKLHAKGRWFASGVCPGVGVGGYVLGGGHGPYEGTLGMACDALVSVTLVDRLGNIITASANNRQELFWGMCSGGGQLGIVTSFRMRTPSSSFYDRSVVFHITWNRARAGEVVSKYLQYDEHGGRNWVRLEQGARREIIDSYGACFDVSSVDECWARLSKAAFFNVPTRKVTHISKVNGALDLHAFFSPDGDFGKKRAPDVRAALLGQEYSEKGLGNERLHQSSFLSLGAKTDAKFWQRWSDICAWPGLGTIPWQVCQVNTFQNAVRKPRKNAFPHRASSAITLYIIGGGTDSQKGMAFYRMLNHFKPHTNGAVYVNYPALVYPDYARRYWGKSLARLKALKRLYDPFLFFANKQPIPR